MEKRKHPRIKIDNLPIDVSDGTRLFQGSVSDISLSGIRINELPDKLNMNAKIITIVFSENKKLFKMEVTPRWHHDNDGRTSMGVKILNTPWNWTDYIIKHEIIPGHPHRLTGTAFSL